MMDDRPGCLSGIFKFFLLGWLYDSLQDTFGYGRGGCIGCGCGTILLILMIIAVLSIIFNTDWLSLTAIPGFPVM